MFLSFQQTTLQSSTFEGKIVSCTAGSIPTNNNQACGKNQCMKTLEGRVHLSSAVA